MRLTAIATYSLLAITAVACVRPIPAATSREVLGPEASTVIVMRPLQPAALDVTRMFAQRGFALVEMQRDPRGMLLRLEGDRKVVTQEVVGWAEVAHAWAHALDPKPDDEHYHHHHPPRTEQVEVGSVFYVRLEPRGETATSIHAVGRPMADGSEACTADALPAACKTLHHGDVAVSEVSGVAEAEVVEGVFAELRLQGDVVWPPVPTAEERTATIALGKCRARQRELRELAAKVSDPRARAGILRTSPRCDAQAAVVARTAP